MEAVVFYFKIGAAISILAPLFKSLQRPNERRIPVVMSVLLWATLLYNLLEFVLPLFQITNTLIGSIFVLVQYVLIALLYYVIYFRRRIQRIVVAASSTLFLAGSLIKILSSGPSVDLNSNLASISALLLVLFSLFFLYNTYKDTPVDDIMTFGHFWVNTAYFYQFTLYAFLVLGMGNLFSHNKAEADIVISIFQSLGVVVMNVLLSIGIHYVLRPTEEKGKYYDSRKETPRAEEVHYVYQRLKNVH